MRIKVQACLFFLGTWLDHIPDRSWNSVRPGPQFKDRSDGATSRLCAQTSVSSFLSSHCQAMNTPARRIETQDGRSLGLWVPVTDSTAPPTLGLDMREK